MKKMISLLLALVLLAGLTTGLIPGLTVYAYAGTAAGTCAVENGIPFVVPENTNPGESQPGAQADPAPSFEDVKPGEWYSDAVAWAVEKDVTKGTSSDTFSPNEACTRAQVVTFLWRANSCPEPTLAVDPFGDVSPDDYYFKAVLWAVEKIITKGTSDTEFSPNDSCTRAQVVTFLARAFIQNHGGDTVIPFTDVDEFAYYYFPMCWAYSSGITAGTSETTFSPDDPCTRAQIVTFLYRAYTLYS